jgi:hypothetical protein
MSEDDSAKVEPSKTDSVKTLDHQPAADATTSGAKTRAEA